MRKLWSLFVGSLPILQRLPAVFLEDGSNQGSSVAVAVSDRRWRDRGRDQRGQNRLDTLIRRFHNPGPGQAEFSVKVPCPCGCGDALLWLAACFRRVELFRRPGAGRGGAEWPFPR